MRLDTSVFTELAHTKFSEPMRGLDRFLSLLNDTLAISAHGAEAVLQNKYALAYMFATAYHETAFTFEPVEEKGSDQYLSKYWTHQNLRTALGNEHPEDATRFKGRGYVQLTGRKNYQLFSDLLKTDLVNHPEMAGQSALAFQVILLGMSAGLFTGAGLLKSLRVFERNPNPSQDQLKSYFINSRKIINGTDQAEKIAGYALSFLVIIEKARVTDKVVEEVCLPATSEATSQLPAPEIEPSVQIDTPQVIEPTAANPSASSGIGLPEIITKISQGGRKRLTSFLSAMGIGLAGFLEWINSHPVYALIILVTIIVLVAFFIWIQSNLDKHRMTIAADPDKNNVI